MLCTVMIPSRWRFDKLLDCLTSWLVHTTNLDDLQIIVRLHETDTASTARMSELEEAFPTVQVVTGPDKPRSEANNWLWEQMRPMAEGTWHQYWSDDMQIYGKNNWDDQLREVPLSGYIAHPEFHRLGGSTYVRDNQGPVPFIPASCYAQYGIKKVMEPADVGFKKLLEGRHHWKPWFLEGVGVFHDREVDRTLTER